MVNLVINRQEIEQVTTFKYVGVIMTEKGICVKDVKNKNCNGRNILQQIKELLTQGLKKDLKKNLFKTLIDMAGSLVVVKRGQ